jgi:dynein heavy chain, axonemal
VFALGLHTQAEFIGELSANANKELSIEVSLDGITSRWQDITIDIVDYKEVYHKIRSTEDLFQVRYDPSVGLTGIVYREALGS